mgnify:FL=1
MTRIHISREKLQFKTNILTDNQQDMIREIASVVIIDENNAIGVDGGLLCHLPNDLKHFKNVTTGHNIIMGRRTYESLPKGALPNRINIVVTSDREENYPGCTVVRSVEEAFEAAEADKHIYIIGGGQIYNATFDMLNTLYLSRIHHRFEKVDTYFPEINFDEWELVEEEHHQADDRHAYDYSFLKYVKK